MRQCLPPCIVSLREKGVDLNPPALPEILIAAVSLREKGVDLNSRVGDDEPIEACLPS